MSLAVSGCQAVPVEQYFDANTPVTIEKMQLDADGNLVIGVRAGEATTALLLRADGPAAVKQVVAKMTVSANASLEWVDHDAFVRLGARYYSVAVGTGRGRWTNPEEWAVFVQPRSAGERYLVSLPVDLGSDSALHGKLGRQLGHGLHAGEMEGVDADHVEIMDPAGTWRHYHWIAGPNYSAWWDLESKTLAKAVIKPGVAFWIERGNGAAQTGTHGVFYGRTLTGKTAVEFKTDVSTGTPFGIPLSRPLHHRNTESEAKYSTPANQLGFAAQGSGGKTSDHRQKDAGGDQIWVWRNNEWQGYYWLMGHVGPKWDGRWWDNRTRDFADFTLEPGMGYYYRHRANRWGGQDFLWRPVGASANNR